MKKNKIRFQAILLIFAFLVLFYYFLPIKKVFAGPDGSGNNFFFKGPTAFGITPPNKFITFQGLTYQTFGSHFTNTGAVENNSAQTDKFVLLPEFIWTKNILGITNFFEVVTPLGSAANNITVANQPSSQPSNFSNSSGGLGDILFFYGIFSKNYSYGNINFNFFPQISITMPTGQWNPDSSVNIGGDEWQIMPTITGQITYKLPVQQSVAFDYALGYSKNEGHSTINVAEPASYTDPGNNIFLDTYLNYFITPKLDLYNESAYIKQFNNYGYINSSHGTINNYGLINNGYKDVISGFGIDYHFTPTFQIDGRVLKDLHGDNGPDGYYGMVDIIASF
ncbi:MAG: transporter [Candidatus Acidulodesulfobacterium sp.]